MKIFLEFNELNTEKLFQNRFNILIILLIILSSLFNFRLYFLQVVALITLILFQKQIGLEFISTPQGEE